MPTPGRRQRQNQKRASWGPSPVKFGAPYYYSLATGRAPDAGSGHRAAVYRTTPPEPGRPGRAMRRLAHNGQVEDRIMSRRVWITVPVLAGLAALVLPAVPRAQ